MVLQAQASLDGARNKVFKAKLPDIYYSRSHKKCYNFYQLCEDHFTTTRAIGPNQILFTDFFL